LECVHLAGQSQINESSGNSAAGSLSVPDVVGVASEVAAISEPTLKQQLEMAMKESMSLPESDRNASAASRAAASRQLTNVIKAEVAVFVSSGSRGRCLEQVYGNLLTIPATSVEAERAFSAAGVLATKVRSRISDTSLDKLCFLRALYYRARKNK